MNFLKKVGALISASVLTGVALLGVAAAVANAAEVAITIEPAYLAPGQTTIITVSDCEVGSTLSYVIDGEPQADPVVLTEENLADAVTTEVDYEVELAGAEIEISATCTNEEEAATTATDSIFFFGLSYVEATPSSFFTGDTISITAGDFLPGKLVTMTVFPKGSDSSVQTETLGTVVNDFSATGDVVFPKALANGDYVLKFSDGESPVVEVPLYIGGRPTVEPTPTLPPSVTQSASASSSASSTPTKKPSSPRLPSTGN